MNEIAEYIWLFTAGALLTVGSIERTILAGEGRWVLSGLSAFIVSLTMWYSVRAAADHDCFSFGIFSAGTVVASSLSGLYHKFRSTTTKSNSDS